MCTFMYLCRTTRAVADYDLDDRCKSRMTVDTTRRIMNLYLMHRVQSASGRGLWESTGDRGTFVNLVGTHHQRTEVMIMLVEMLLTSCKSHDKRQLMRNQSPRVLAHPINEKSAGICGDPYHSAPSLSSMADEAGWAFRGTVVQGVTPRTPTGRILKSPAHPYTEYEPCAFRASQEYRRMPSGWPPG